MFLNDKKFKTKFSVWKLLLICSMKTEFFVSGMTCEACKYKVEHLLKGVDGVERVEANFQTGKVEIESAKALSLHELKAALEHTSKYSIALPENPIANKPSKLSTYKPLFVVFAYIIVVSYAASWAVGQHLWINFGRFFMAAFFIVFSFFKMLDIPAFASSFSMYDIVAKRVYAYGFVYPFIELALGIAFVLNWQPVAVNWLTLVVMSVGTIGVLQSVISKKQIQCACLGTVFNLPMSYLTIIENSIMIAMSALMLIFM